MHIYNSTANKGTSTVMKYAYTDKQNSEVFKCGIAVKTIIEQCLLLQNEWDQNLINSE